MFYMRNKKFNFLVHTLLSKVLFYPCPALLAIYDNCHLFMYFGGIYCKNMDPVQTAPSVCFCDEISVKCI